MSGAEWGMERMQRIDMGSIHVWLLLRTGPLAALTLPPLILARAASASFDISAMSLSCNDLGASPALAPPVALSPLMLPTSFDRSPNSLSNNGFCASPLLELAPPMVPLASEALLALAPALLSSGCCAFSLSTKARPALETSSAACVTDDVALVADSAACSAA